MSTPEEITIEIPTLRLRARAWGPADGVPTLALHGWLDNAATFDLVAPHLPGLRLVCLDLPGHGHSDHAGPGQGYAFIDTVARIHEVTMALGWKRFCMLGHSLGAALSSVYAGTFPGRVQRLALIEGLGPVTEEPQHAAERLAKSLEEQARRQGRTPPVYPGIDEAVRRLGVSMSRLSPQAAKVLCERGLKPVEGGVTWRSDPRLRLPSRLRLTEEQVLVFLRAITCPTFMVRGSEGFPFAPKPMSARVSALQNSEMVELPGGHHLHLDTPVAVADALRGFFAPLVQAH